MANASKPVFPTTGAAFADSSIGAVAALMSMFDLEQIEQNIFRGASLGAGRRIFGGLVVAQALVAAARTVVGRSPHSLHGYFLLPGDPQVPVVYMVDRLRDGQSFAARRCDAIQHGRAIFSLSASFHIEEQGLDHSAPMPDVPAPEALPAEPELLARFGAGLSEPVRRYLSAARPIELRPVDPQRYLGRAPGEPAQAVWMRVAAPLPDDPAIHRAAFAYMSDLTLLDTALLGHGLSVVDAPLQLASVDHALWLHRPFRADDWLLFAQQSPNASGARGLTYGLVYTRGGTLVASAMQEGLMRPIAP